MDNNSKYSVPSILRTASAEPHEETGLVVRKTENGPGNFKTAPAKNSIGMLSMEKRRGGSKPMLDLSALRILLGMIIYKMCHPAIVLGRSTSSPKIDPPIDYMTTSARGRSLMEGQSRSVQLGFGHVFQERHTVGRYSGSSRKSVFFPAASSKSPNASVQGFPHLRVLQSV